MHAWYPAVDGTVHVCLISRAQQLIHVLYLPHTGVLWPLEGMPTVLRYIGSILPMTYPAQAMRAAMGRGVILYIHVQCTVCSLGDLIQPAELLQYIP